MDHIIYDIHTEQKGPCSIAGSQHPYERALNPRSSFYSFSRYSTPIHQMHCKPHYHDERKDYGCIYPYLCDRLPI